MKVCGLFSSGNGELPIYFREFTSGEKELLIDFNSAGILSIYGFKDINLSGLDESRFGKSLNFVRDALNTVQKESNNELGVVCFEKGLMYLSIMTADDYLIKTEEFNTRYSIKDYDRDVTISSYETGSRKHAEILSLLS